MLVLSGCDRSAEGLMDDYVSRVANVLDASPAEVTPMPLPTYPRHRAIVQPLPDIRIDLLDAWALRGCEVFSLIGERNSILGKVARPATRLDYERRLLTLLPRCLESEADLEEELRTELGTLLEAKRNTFAVHLWNASLANPDYQQYWSGGSDPFAVEDSVDAQVYGAAQQRLAQLVATPMTSDLDAWLDTLQWVAQYPMGGHSLQSMRLAMQRLDQAEALLRQAAQDRRLCPMGPALKELGYARNVMVNIFTQEVQPWLVTVDKRFLAGAEPLRKMRAELPIENEPMTAFVAELDDWHQTYRARIRRQVDAWQDLFSACGRQAVPGN